MVGMENKFLHLNNQQKMECLCASISISSFMKELGILYLSFFRNHISLSDVVHMTVIYLYYKSEAIFCPKFLALTQ